MEYEHFSPEQATESKAVVITNAELEHVLADAATKESLKENPNFVMPKGEVSMYFLEERDGLYRDRLVLRVKDDSSSHTWEFRRPEAESIIKSYLETSRGFDLPGRVVIFAAPDTSREEYEEDFITPVTTGVQVNWSD